MGAKGDLQRGFSLLHDEIFRLWRNGASTPISTWAAPEKLRDAMSIGNCTRGPIRCAKMAAPRARGPQGRGGGTTLWGGKERKYQKRASRRRADGGHFDAIPERARGTGKKRAARHAGYGAGRRVTQGARRPGKIGRACVRAGAIGRRAKSDSGGGPALGFPPRPPVRDPAQTGYLVRPSPMVRHPPPSPTSPHVTARGFVGRPALAISAERDGAFGGPRSTWSRLGGRLRGDDARRHRGRFYPAMLRRGGWHGPVGPGAVCWGGRRRVRARCAGFGGGKTRDHDWRTFGLAGSQGGRHTSRPGHPDGQISTNGRGGSPGP